jgi:hypothetical protein
VSVVVSDRLFKLGNESHYGPAAGVPWPTIYANKGLVKFGAQEKEVLDFFKAEGKNFLAVEY